MSKLFLYCCLIFFQACQIGKFWRATCLFELFKYILCDNWRMNLCGSVVLLFSVFKNIVSVLKFGQVLTNFIFIVHSTKSSLYFMTKKISCFKLMSIFLGKSKIFCFCCYYKFLASNMHSHYYSDLIKWSFLVILLYWCKVWMVCLISFFSSFEFFPAIICRNTAGSLVNSWLGVKIFNNFSFFLFFFITF